LAKTSILVSNLKTSSSDKVSAILPKDFLIFDID
jgi:hypothetical protein